MSTGLILALAVVAWLLIGVGVLALCRASADGDRAMREALRESAREHQRGEDGRS
jgi:hypothetical protein